MNVELIGCGGSAHHIVIPLAQLLVLHRRFSLRLWDGDTFEERNSSRQFLAASNIHKNKAECMAEAVLRATKLKCKVEKDFFYFDKAKDIIENNSVIICLADNHPARRECHRTVNNKGGILISSASEGQQGEGWVYRREFGGSNADPFKRYPDILTSTSNDPRSPESCQSEIQLTENPQTPFENFMSGFIVLTLFNNWILNPCSDTMNNIGEITWVKNRVTSRTLQSFNEHKS